MEEKGITVLPHGSTDPTYAYIPTVGGVAQWLERPSLAGRLSLIYA